jgi:hypothetical protein
MTPQQFHWVRQDGRTCVHSGYTHAVHMLDLQPAQAFAVTLASPPNRFNDSTKPAKYENAGQQLLNHSFLDAFFDTSITNQ